MGIETAVAVIGAVAAAASAAQGIRGMVGGGGGKGTVSPTTDTTQMSRALLPAARANTAAGLGGGFSPDYLAGVVQQQSGQPGAGMDILDQIRREMGTPQGP